MNPGTHTPALGYAALTALLCWRVYVRFRRALGPQPLSRYRAPITLAIYGLLLAVLLPALWGHVVPLVTWVAAMAAGALLAVWALRKTVFVARPGALQYTPYAPIALTLAALFAVRVAYRVLEVTVLAPHQPGLQGLTAFVRSPLTLAAFGLWVGYNLRYTLGLWAWRRRVLAAKRARDGSP